MKRGSRSLVGTFLTGALILSFSISAQDFSEDTAAVLVTEAGLAEYGKGRVLGYFPNALISRDPLRRTRGYFIFDSDAQRFEKTQIPLQITFERGTRVLDEATKEWKEVTPETFTYALATDVFLTKLRALMAESKTTIGTGFLPTSPFDGLKSIAKETPVSRYLLKQGSEISYLVEIGDRGVLETKHRALTLPEPASQVAIYHQHFRSLSLQMQLYKLRPGQRPSNPRLIKGLVLARHRHEAMTEGRLVVNYGGQVAPWTMLLNKLTFDGGSASFSMPAAAFLQNIVAPLLTEKGVPLKLDCVIGDVEDETACKKAEGGAYSIEGKLGSGETVSLVVERAALPNEPADAYRDLYRIDLQSIDGAK